MDSVQLALQGFILSGNRREAQMHHAGTLPLDFSASQGFDRSGNRREVQMRHAGTLPLDSSSVSRLLPGPLPSVSFHVQPASSPRAAVVPWNCTNTTLLEATAHNLLQHYQQANHQLISRCLCQQQAAQRASTASAPLAQLLGIGGLFPLGGLPPTPTLMPILLSPVAATNVALPAFAP